MNKAEFVRAVTKTWTYAQVMGIEQILVGSTPLKVSDNFKVVSLDSESSYEEVYLTGLSMSDYNILLYDYSFLQFFISTEGEARYAYYPNPFLGASVTAMDDLRALKELLEDGEIEVETYLHYIAEIRCARHPPLLRYENAPSQYVELKHPCSHLHFGHHDDNRWPLNRTLTPDAFGLMIFKYFYSKSWDKAGRVRAGSVSLSLEQVFGAAKYRCRVLPDSLFSADEKGQFYYGG